MKKFLALFLALSCVISITGCSEQDKKFVETLRPVQTNTSISTSTVDLKFNYKEFEKIVDDIKSYKIPADGEEYYSEESLNDELEQSKIVDKDGNISVSMIANTKSDPTKNYADGDISLSVGSVSLKLGDVYVRGNDIYYSREYLLNSLTLGGLLVGSNDTEVLNEIDELKNNVNKALDGKKYIKVSSGVSPGAGNIVSNYALNTRKEKQIDDFLTVFKDFNSLSVKETENGATFELDSDSYSAFITRTCEYLRARKDSYEQLFGIESSNYDESDAFFDAVIALVNNDSFNNFMETAGLKFTVNDTVGKTDDTHYTDTIEGVFGKNGAYPIGTLTAKTEYTLTDNVTFENIDESINYMDVMLSLLGVNTVEDKYYTVSILNVIKLF